MINKIQVEKVEKSIRIPRDVIRSLKEIGLYGKIKFMRKEVLLCPLAQSKRSPIVCLTCQYFVRRVKGLVYCKYTD